MSNLPAKKFLAKPWLDKLKQVCETCYLEHIDLIIDQAGLEEPLYPVLSHIDPNLEWSSLFKGLPEEGHEAQAPLLIRFSLDKPEQMLWLEKLIEWLAYEPRLLVLCSPLPFNMLQAFLTSLVEAKWQTYSAILRFYDTRIFPLLIQDILTTEQQNLFLNLGYAWSWIDRDQQPQYQLGIYHPEVEELSYSTLEFNDQQVDLLNCISDAERVLMFPQYIDKTQSNEANFLRFYVYAKKAIEEQYYGPLDAYIAKQAKPAT
ncbi:DUF4123 domain-containing protein [Pseudomonas sp. F1_0610]|uniref:DUF4123 domain-containing protein n=1 Tax=Pseudomonas sp. F1_0610 TaxID=3114284 RepID=UPI0039C14F9C